ncbi:PKD domain-containing protein [Algoriphagus halophilus]|uniref:PKD domain-containing protein n=1 Tax=Algoriphagus halophilus TaxID=226505 RepID=UPI00358EF5FD
MEHKAGVPKGGTFILLYNGATDLVLTLPEINFNANFFNPNFISGLSFAASDPKATPTPTPGIREAFNLTDTSKKERAVDLKNASKTEFEFASELIKKLNLGDAAKNVLDALNLKDREIRDQATPIAKGTVIADFYLPYLCCSECPPIAYILPDEEPENIGPIADAGEDQTFTLGPNQPIAFTLDGTASKDEDGTIISFAWSQISGPPITLKTPNQPKASAEIKTAGEYVFELTVTDDQGASNKDSVKITIIEPENIGPVANAGRDQTLTIAPSQPVSVTLDGSGSKDEDGTITAFAWTQISGSSVTLKTPNKPKTAVEFSAPGEYEFELKVTDNRGASNKDSVKISVAAPENRGPLANAGRDQKLTIAPNQPISVTLDGSGSKDEDGTITAFAWAQISGSSVTLKTPNKPKTTVEFSAPGEYEFELKVTDNQGASNKDSVRISVGAPENRGPIAEAGKDQSITLVPGQPANVTLDGSASKDEDGTIASFAWTKVSGPQVSLKTPNKPKTAAVISTAGVYVFELLVKDDKGASNKDSVTITARAAQNNPPVANAGSDISITIDNPNSPGTANLDGSKSADPENGPLTFNWRFANGPVTPTILKPNQAKTSVTGLLEGNYTFTLIVKDSAGISASDSVLVKVAAAPTDTDTRTKTCGPLSNVMNAFIKFDKTEQTTSFKKFLETFGSYSEVKEFFTSMKTIASSNLTKQTDFFAKAFGNTGLISKLMDWLEKLHQIILEFKDFRTFAFQLYQIISQLVTYMVCIQKEDYDAAKIPMEKVFDVIEAHAKSWAELKASGAFGRADIAAIARIEAGFTAASTQTRVNGEATAKPKYLRKIKVLEGLL